MIKKLSEVLKERSDVYYRDTIARNYREGALTLDLERYLSGDLSEYVVTSISDTTALYQCRNFPLNELRMGRQSLFRSTVSDKITYRREVSLGDNTKLYGLNVRVTLKELYMDIGDNTIIGNLDITSGYYYGGSNAGNVVANINIGNNVYIGTIHIKAGNIFVTGNRACHVDICIEDDVAINYLLIKLPSECTHESRIELRIGKGTIMIGGNNGIELPDTLVSPRGTIVDIGTNNVCRDLSMIVGPEKDPNKQRIVRIGSNNTLTNVSVVTYGDVSIGNNNMISTRQELLFSEGRASAQYTQLTLDSSKNIAVGDRNYIAASITSKGDNSNGRGVLGYIIIGNDTKVVGRVGTPHPTIIATDMTLEDGATLVVATNGIHTSRADIRTRIIVGKDATFAVSPPCADTGFGYNVIKIKEIRIPNNERVLT